MSGKRLREMKMRSPRMVTKSVTALALATWVVLVMGAGVASLMGAGVASAGDPGQSSPQACRPPDHRFGLSGWKHGDSFSLVAPPNWNCGSRSTTKVQCKDEGPDHRFGLSGWKHGDSFSLVPPPNWKCRSGSAGDSASPSPTPSPSPSPVAPTDTAMDGESPAG